ncbi:TRAP transporter small permease [Marinobacter sp. F3R08]|uniref:TRAP transporter small permease n=1 Tax=Marinobacter sp. F3R08 TaxID=2841559 RepID=UPI001C0911FD|nr:TRAP transporter small permease [Marinobacter sp. F3R08]MBU2952920.1 TRAP transporter small permease [Marinobacter sp. F3R08]
MRVLNGLYHVFGFIKGLGLVFSGLALAGMILSISADVFSRNVTGNSIPGVYEIVMFYLMPLSVLPIVFYAFSMGVSPRIPMLFDRLPGAVQKPLYLLVITAEFSLMAIVAFYSLGYALDGAAAGHAFPAAGEMYPKYPVYFLVPFGFVGMAVELAFIGFKNLFHRGLWITYNKDQDTILRELQV